MNENKILGVTVISQTKSDILEKIIKYIKSPKKLLHIVCLNPENMVIAKENKNFKKVLETAQIKLIDGIGVVIAGRIKNIRLERLTGVDLMEELIKLASIMRLRVLFIGGKPNLALNLVDCYSKKFSKAKFFGTEGIKDIKNPRKSEEEAIFSIVRVHKPHLIFVAFGSPDQELWIDRHFNKFDGAVVMGVGGAFDYLSGKVKRANNLIRMLGFEWLFRLIIQPWRWRRQLRLLKFIKAVFEEKWKKN